ncbi:MAG: hypothetical protein FJ146_01210 [Deltaproteobacteria bacterium]|nr:hypothetical protein [Deltaproteobacteria bacterium]
MSQAIASTKAGAVSPVNHGEIDVFLVGYADPYPSWLSKDIQQITLQVCARIVATYRNFDSDDGSTNTWWVAVVAFGEGWHNNHHAFPDVARAGIKWWEIDPTMILIRALERIGIVTQVKRRQ